MTDRVITDNSDFIAAWEARKKEQDAFHKKAHRRIIDMCVFAKEKIVGK